MSPAAADLLHSWNPRADAALRGVRIEDDVRESLQSVAVRRPSLGHRTHLLDLAAAVGVHVSFLGFPAASHNEYEQCAALVRHIVDNGLDIEPVLMARAVPSDLTPLLEIGQSTGAPVLADLYLSTSPLRCHVEDWSLPDMLHRLQRVARRATAEGLDFRIAFEDSTRTPPDVLADCITAAVDVGARCVVLNDTVGQCLPEGAARHTEFAREVLSRAGSDAVLAWHGHNDRGLALANSLAAARAGAGVISGTFLGLGERTGNLALEQFIAVLAEAGHTDFDLKRLPEMCAAVAEVLHVDVPAHQPLVGADAFSTATGTHATALVKARAMGRDFEDLIYSAVEAASLGREQTLLMGPNSSGRSIATILGEMGLPADDAAVAAVLDHCKQRATTLRGREEAARVLDLAARPSPHTVPPA
ncbi:hypothetical protein [Streptomyces litmocidini]|uniref:2-isopropylmalate synthase n=1 Tax=Streptomyces litmocidini TaxID=67318 RepID=A0ABW7U871_9ACTN